MIDLFSHLFNTLKASNYFQTDLSGFQDPNGNFKVFLEGEALGYDQTPFVTIKILPTDQAQATDWSTPQVIFTVYGKETERTQLVAITNQIRTIFKELEAFASVSGAARVGYQLVGPAVFTEDRDPVTELINRSVGLSFGTDE